MLKAAFRRFLVLLAMVAGVTAALSLLIGLASGSSATRAVSLTAVRRSASGDMARTRYSLPLVNRFRKKATSSGMSSGRSRSEGTSI